eukprot:snap_masked-scaffold_31-processed-gene-3.49-mRNA-1 protein AED:1.00 eAED:1.00 QI:0/0/0/0/1/1/2/0/100
MEERAFYDMLSKFNKVRGNDWKGHENRPFQYPSTAVKAINKDQMNATGLKINPRYVELLRRDPFFSSLRNMIYSETKDEQQTVTKITHFIKATYIFMLYV